MGFSYPICFISYQSGGGTQKGAKDVITKIRNFLWAGSNHPARARVVWHNLSRPRSEGGLNLVDPQQSLISLMCKWVLTSCEPGNSNFKQLLRYRLLHCQPQNGESWPPSLEWFTMPTYKAPTGSKIWGRVMRSWKSLVGKI